VDVAVDLLREGVAVDGPAADADLAAEFVVVGADQDFVERVPGGVFERRAVDDAVLDDPALAQFAVPADDLVLDPVPLYVDAAGHGEHAGGNAERAEGFIDLGEHGGEAWSIAALLPGLAEHRVDERLE